LTSTSAREEKGASLSLGGRGGGACISAWGEERGEKTVGFDCLHQREKGGSYLSVLKKGGIVFNLDRKKRKQGICWGRKGQ